MLTLASSPLLCSLRRVETAWNVVGLAGIVNAGFLLVRLIGDRWAWSHLDPYALEYSEMGKTITLATLCFAALGVLIANITTEIIGCPFTWFSRGLRKRLKLELWLLVLVPIALLFAYALVVKAPLGIVGIPILALAPGMEINNPRFGTAMTLGGLVLVFTLAVASELLIEFAKSAPLLPGAIGIAMFAAVLSWNFSLGAGRGILTGGALVLGNASRHPFAVQPWERRRLRGGKLLSIRWNGPAIRTAADLRRAVTFERWGWSRGIWPLGRLGAAGASVLIVLAFGLLIGLRSGFQSADTVKLIFTLTGDTHQLDSLGLAGVGRRSLLALMMPGTLFCVLLAIGDRMQPALRPGHLYAMSRSERADLLWRGSLENWLPQIARIAFALLVLMLASGLASGSSFSPRPPHFVTSLAIISVSLPLFQLMFGLRELYPKKRLTTVQIIAIMTVLASGAAFLLLLGQAGIDDISPTMAWLVTLACLGLAFPGQFALRQFLRRRLASMPLD